MPIYNPPYDILGNAATATTANAANGINSSSTTVVTTSAAAPSIGQVLIASSSTSAGWGTLGISGGGTNATSFTSPSGTINPLVFYDGAKLNTDTIVANCGYDSTNDIFYTGKLSVSTAYAQAATLITTVAQSTTGGLGEQTYADPGAAILSGNRVGYRTFGGSVDAAHTLVDAVYMDAFATENWSGTANGSSLVFSVTPNATTTKTNVLTLGNDLSATFPGGTVNIGSGVTGFSIRPWTTTTSGAIYSSGVTPAAGNFAVRVNPTATLINSATGGTVQLCTNGNAMLAVSSGGVFGPSSTILIASSVNQIGSTKITPLITSVAPTGVPSTTGGTIAASTTNYAYIVSLDTTGGTLGTQSAAVTTTGSSSSIVWSWAPTNAAVSYQIWCSTTPGVFTNYFTSATNTFTQILPASSGTAGTLPTVNSTGQLSLGTGLDGMTLRNYVGGGAAALYSNNITPSTSNYTLYTTGSVVSINGSTSSNLYVGGSAIITATATAVTTTKPISAPSLTLTVPNANGYNEESLAYVSSGASGAAISLKTARGTSTTPTVTLSGDMLSSIDTYGYTGSGWGYSAGIDVVALSTFSGTNTQSRFTFSTTPASSTTPGIVAYIDNGGISTIGQLSSTIITGTAPIVVSSSTPVIGLNTTGNAATSTTTAALTTATTVVSVAGATAPSAGQVLTATGPASATWQTPTGGGGGGSSIIVSSQQVLVSSVPVNSGNFQITDIFVVGKTLILSVGVGPYTGKGSIPDEIEMDQITVVGYVLNATTAQCYWTSDRNLVLGYYQFNYWQSA